MDIEALERMLARGQDSPMLRFTLGNACRKEGRLEDAIGHFTAAVGQDPAYSPAWQALGRAQEKAGDREAALATYRQGLAAARDKGDMQVVRAQEVFVRRLERAARDG